jgi:hypothetical protein
MLQDDMNNSNDDTTTYITNNYGEDAKRIEKVSKTASDYWIEYDKARFKDDKIFEELVEKMQKKDSL